MKAVDLSYGRLNDDDDNNNIAFELGTLRYKSLALPLQQLYQHLTAYKAIMLCVMKSVQ